MTEPVINVLFETTCAGITGTTAAKVKRIEREDDGSYTVIIDHWPQNVDLPRPPEPPPAWYPEDHPIPWKQLTMPQALELRKIYDEELVWCRHSRKCIPRKDAELIQFRIDIQVARWDNP